MGINTGFCNVGNFGSSQRLTYTVIGAEVNLTQRLESNADIDGILISHETFSNTKEVIDVVEKETITMKGITRKIQTYNVLGLKNNLKESLIDKKIASISNLDNSDFSQKEKSLLIEFIKNKLI
jgi:adenylate cyclase